MPRRVAAGAKHGAGSELQLSYGTGDTVDGVGDGRSQVVNVRLCHTTHVDTAVGQHIDMIFLRHELHLVGCEKTDQQ